MSIFHPTKCRIKATLQPVGLLPTTKYCRSNCEHHPHTGCPENLSPRIRLQNHRIKEPSELEGTTRIKSNSWIHTVPPQNQRLETVSSSHTLSSFLSGHRSAVQSVKLASKSTISLLPMCPVNLSDEGKDLFIGDNYSLFLNKHEKSFVVHIYRIIKQ